MLCCVAFFRDFTSASDAYRRLADAAARKQPFLGLQALGLGHKGHRPYLGSDREDVFIIFPIQPAECRQFEESALEELFVLEMSTSEAWENLNQGGRETLRGKAVTAAQILGKPLAA